MSIVDLLGEFDSPRVHTYGKPHVSKEGMLKINELLASKHSVAVPPGFAPLLETSRGKVTSRIERIMRDYNNVKITIVVKQEIGNIVERYALKGSSYIFDFTNEVLTWENGEFGNAGSCWRNTHASSVPMFLAGTGYGQGFTIRTFKPNVTSPWHGGMAGSGRCWILPYKENNMVLFNAYGERLPVFLSIVLACLPKGDFATKEVGVSNEADGMYLNGSKGTIVYPVQQKPRDRLSLDMPRFYTVECKGCGYKYGAEDVDAPRYCNECKGYCSVTGKVQSKVKLAEVFNVNVSYEDRSYYIEHGFVGEKVQKGLWFCNDCLEWRGDLDGC